MGSDQSSPAQEDEGGHHVELEGEEEGDDSPTSAAVDDASGAEDDPDRSVGREGSGRRSGARAPPQCRPRDDEPLDGDHPAALAPYRRTASHLAAAAALQQQNPHLQSHQEGQQHRQQQQRMQPTSVAGDENGRPRGDGEGDGDGGTMMEVDLDGEAGGGEEGMAAVDGAEESSTSTPASMEWSSHGAAGGSSAPATTTMAWPSSSSSFSRPIGTERQESLSPGRQQRRRRTVGLGRGRHGHGGGDGPIDEGEQLPSQVAGVSSMLFPRRRRSSSVPYSDAATSDTGGSSSSTSAPSTSTSTTRTQKKKKDRNVNVVRALWARETTGLTSTSRFPDLSHAVGSGPTGGDGFTLNILRSLGGTSFYQKIDRPSGGMPSEVVLLNQCMNRGDWDGVSSVVDRIAPRLIGEYGEYAGGGHHHHYGDMGGNGEGPQPPFDDVPQPPPNGNGSTGRPSFFSPLDGGDPALAPATNWRGRGGYGRYGYERDAFVLSGGVETLMRVFHERCFVVEGWKRKVNPPHVGMGVGGGGGGGASSSSSSTPSTDRGLGGNNKRRRRQLKRHYPHQPRPLVVFLDARSMTEEYVSTKLANTWNESLTVLRELIFHVPEILDRILHMPLPQRRRHHMEDNHLAENGEGSDGRGEFLPWLFTLLSHDSCFDAAAALIEEILSLQSQVASAGAAAPLGGAGEEAHDGMDGQEAGGAVGGGGHTGGGGGPPLVPSVVSPSTFHLGDVADLYELWGNFSCRQLAHFCRILALLVFEPEDRHMMESPAVTLRSLELLRLRRDRSARAGGLLRQGSSSLAGHGGDSSASYVDRNQAIVLGDQTLCKRLIDLLRIMNYAPELRRVAPYHVITHLPWIADTLVMLGLNEMEDWDDLDRLDALARRRRSRRHRRGRSQSRGGSGGEELDDGPADGKDGDYDVDGDVGPRPSELGSVADMFESLANTLLPSSSTTSTSASTSAGTTQHATHLSHIIHVINAAQAAGVVVNRRRTTNTQRGTTQGGRWQVQVEVRQEDTGPGGGGDGDSSSPTMRNVARSALSLTDQLFFRRRGPDTAVGDGRNDDRDDRDEDDSVVDDAGGVDAALLRSSTAGAGLLPQNLRTSRYRINRPDDAANELQFNALLLAPYQVEVLFVLCTLLGGRRKMDAQATVADLGLVGVLDEMFDRLSWGPPSPSGDDVHDGSSSGAEFAAASSQSYYHHQHQHQEHEHQQGSGSSGGGGGGGIHGPGCECNPESALRVQYLRLIHNFCDRDCDNYGGRRLLLSEYERRLVFSASSSASSSNHPPSLDHGRKLTTTTRPRRAGLLSKVVDAFVREPDDSPYKFWLSSCVESYLRGSSPAEQLFVANSGSGGGGGLLHHLLNDVTSHGLHTAGGLQTSFDLLGEMCKGNPDAVAMLLSDMDETKFRRLMSVAAANLVDSNVFLRALILTVERVDISAPPHEGSASNEIGPDHHWGGVEQSSFRCASPPDLGYLTHSWWDVPSVGATTAVDSSSTDIGEVNSHTAPPPRRQRAAPPTQTSRGGVQRRIDRDGGMTSDALMVTDVELIGCDDVEIDLDRRRHSDWFVPMTPREQLEESSKAGNGTTTHSHYAATAPLEGAEGGQDGVVAAHGGHVVCPRSASLLNIGDAGWKFSPDDNERMIRHHHHAPPRRHGIGHEEWTRTTLSSKEDLLADHHPDSHPNAYCPNTLARLAWFLVTNQSRLLRDLLDVVDLRNVNHENICCLNTAIVVAMFANRRKELPRVVDELRWMNVVSSVGVGSSLDHLQLDGGRYEEADATYGSSLHGSIGGRKSDDYYSGTTSGAPLVGDRSDVLRNFRELLWFWIEYYAHRGRDRLSLEFSSHLRFEEWMDVVSMLCADDGSRTSLVSRPIPLPRSPYRRAPRSIEGRWRSA